MEKLSNIMKVTGLQIFKGAWVYQGQRGLLKERPSKSSYMRMDSQERWIKVNSVRGHIRITNLFLQEIPILAAKISIL